MRKAKNLLEVLADHIDSFLFDPLKPEHFEEVNFSTVLTSNKILVVIGSKREYDNDEMKVLWKPMKYDCKNSIKLLEEMCKNPDKILEAMKRYDYFKIDRAITPIDKAKHHMILVGGPTVNTLTREIGTRLPLQYVQVNGEDKFYSRLSRKIYPASDHSLVQTIKNPFSNDKIILCVFGIDRHGTKRAIESLIDLLKEINHCKNQADEQFMNKRMFSSKVPTKVPAKVIKKKNETGYDLLD